MLIIWLKYKRLRMRARRCHFLTNRISESCIILEVKRHNRNSAAQPSFKAPPMQRAAASFRWEVAAPS